MLVASITHPHPTPHHRPHCIRFIPFGCSTGNRTTKAVCPFNRSGQLSVEQYYFPQTLSEDITPSPQIKLLVPQVAVVTGAYSLYIQEVIQKL